MEENIPNGNTDPQTNSNEQWKSEHIDKLATALAKAQAEIKGAERNQLILSSTLDMQIYIL